MTATLLFVHGTGVRSSRYATTLRTIEQQVIRHQIDVQVKGCYWGGAVGAVLAAGGASIPDYEESGGRQPSPADQLRALWEILYTDPFWELRLLPKHAAGWPLGLEPPSVTLRSSVAKLTDSDEVGRALNESGLHIYFTSSVKKMLTSSEFAEAIASAPAEPQAHRRAIARALVAMTIAQALDDDLPPIGGRDRDELALLLTSELNGDGLGLGQTVSRSVKRLALEAVTRKLVRDRGSLTDGAAPMAGDVLRFLVSGDEARKYLSAEFSRFKKSPIHLLAHSLGGVMCADVLVRNSVPGIAS